MERLAAVAQRVQELTTALAPPAAPGAFQATLDRHLAPGGTPATAGTSRAPAQTQTLNLGQMLGVLSASPGAAAPGAVVSPHGPSATPAVGQVSAPSDGGGVEGAADVDLSAGRLLRPVQGRVSSNFGMRTHPVTGRSKLHAGIDLAARTGTPIQAAAGGTVVFAGRQGGYGNLVTIDHGNGMTTRYAHQDRIDVRVGQRLAAGVQVGTVGSTGMSTGPHLHFEVRRNGQAINPARWIGL